MHAVNSVIFVIYDFLFTGKLNENVAPLLSALFSAHILPPWASIIFLEINNPKPVPPVCDFEANFVNNFGNMLESIPWPLSFTLTITTWPSFLSTDIDIVPSSVNLIALLIRLSTTCIILPLSASIRILLLSTICSCGYNCSCCAPTSPPPFVSFLSTYTSLIFLLEFLIWFL